MRIDASRRALLAGSAAGALLPFVRLPEARAARPGFLTFGLSSFPPSIQPWANTGTAAATVKLMIYRGLTSYGPDGAIRPELAESWRQVGDTGWEFKLRDASFHNGQKLSSADVKWTIEQVAAEKSTAHFKAQFTGAVVETPDERTVRIIMKSPVSMLPEWMASYHLPIVSRSSTGSAFVGAGPFMIKGQERGVAIDLEPFANFHRKGLPKLKGLRAVAYADENLRVAALRSGDVDLIEYVPWQSMDSITKDPALKLDSIDGAFMFLVFNGGKAPFNDPRVRKAVGHAIKRDELVKAAFFGRGSPLQQLPIAESAAFYNKEFKEGWRYDPALAKKLLADAGVPNGFSCSLLSTAQYGMHKDTAEVVQQHLAAVGIKVELNMPDWATRVALGNKGQYDLAVMGTAADSNDPDGIASFIDGSLSPSYARSVNLPTPKITELLAKGRAEFDAAKRRDIYREVERLAIDEAPIVGLTWRSQGYGMRRQVTGFKNMPGALTFYSGMTFETTDVS